MNYTRSLVITVLASIQTLLASPYTVRIHSITNQSELKGFIRIQHDTIQIGPHQLITQARLAYTTEIDDQTTQQTHRIGTVQFSTQAGNIIEYDLIITTPQTCHIDLFITFNQDGAPNIGTEEIDDDWIVSSASPDSRSLPNAPRDLNWENLFLECLSRGIEFAHDAIGWNASTLHNNDEAKEEPPTYELGTFYTKLHDK